MGQGIERTKIFRNKADREDFLTRLGDLCEGGALIVYAWALMANHFHLFTRTGNRPLSKSMRRLLTGYVINFNLGSDDFVERLICEVDERGKQTLRLSRKVADLASLGRKIARGEGLTVSDLKSGNRKKRVSRARRLFCQLAVRKMGYPGAEVARFLGVTTSAVVRAASSEDLPEIEKYL